MGRRRRVGREVERRPEGDGHGGHAGREQRLASAACGGSQRGADGAEHERGRHPRPPPGPPRSRRRVAWSTTISSVARMAAPDRGGEAAAAPYDDVSAGVRSRGAGWTTTTRASAARRSGSSPASSRTSVTERSATSRASASCAADRTTSIGGCSTARQPPPERRGSARRTPRMLVGVEQPARRGVPQPALDSRLGRGIAPCTAAGRRRRGSPRSTSITWASPCGQRAHVEGVGDREPAGSRARRAAGRASRPATASPAASGRR